MNIIFLDVDGVLNSERSLKANQGYIDPAAVENLKTIVDATGARIVLTSSWRGGWDPDPEKRGEDGWILVHAFDKAGLSIYGKTGFSTVTDMSGRSLEILDWLETSQETVDQFVIIDDGNFRWRKYRLHKHWVKTSFKSDGLTAKHAARAIDILNNKKGLHFFWH